MNPSLIVAIAALLFTIGSFWWIQAHRGKLKMSGVPAFSGFLAKERITLRLPVLLYNTGAATRLVEELRLVVPAWGDAVGDWQTFHPTLNPGDGKADIQDFAGPYAIDGRRAEMRHIKFTVEFAGVLPEPTATTCHVEALLDGSAAWECIGTLTLHLAHMHTPNVYISYRNRAEPCAGEPDKTLKAWAQFAKKHGLTAPWAEERSGEPSVM